MFEDEDLPRVIIPLQLRPSLSSAAIAKSLNRQVAKYSNFPLIEDIGLARKGGAGYESIHAVRANAFPTPSHFVHRIHFVGQSDSQSPDSWSGLVFRCGVARGRPVFGVRAIRARRLRPERER